MESSALAERKPTPLSRKATAALQAALHLRGVGPGQDADDLPRQLGAGVGRPGVEAPAVHHLHGGGLGGLVQGAVGHVVAVGGDEADGAVPSGSPSFSARDSDTLAMVRVERAWHLMRSPVMPPPPLPARCRWPSFSSMVLLAAMSRNPRPSHADPWPSFSRQLVPPAHAVCPRGCWRSPSAWTRGCRCGPRRSGRPTWTRR